MAITASMVKDLREMTGCGMMDSKKALEASNGDMDAAVEYLRKKGLAGAEKKAGRITAEGVSFSKISADGKSGSLVEVNSETDFVAKNEKFRTYVQNVADQALNTKATDLDSFLNEKWALDSSKTVKEELSSQISVIGENLSIRRFGKLVNDKGFVCDYIHAGGKIGVLVSVDTDVVNDSIKEMAKHVAMQVASMRPKFLDESEISESYKVKEKEILLEKAKNDPKNAGKPEEIIKKVVEGGFNKELKEVCLINQVYIMAEDGKQTVDSYVKDVAKKNSANIKIAKFLRYETGEGIEKRQDDFAAEVAKQMA
ncbi:MAG: translation elongation factor Ts [Bacillota bacterium]|nr:translation elongation factor Ts [Bacillota bacterium]